MSVASKQNVNSYGIEYVKIDVNFNDTAFNDTVFKETFFMVFSQIEK